MVASNGIICCVWALSVLQVLIVDASPSSGRGPGPGGRSQRSLVKSSEFETLQPGSLEDAPFKLEDDVWGPVLEERSDREKRLLFKPKATGFASIGAQVGKQVASKAFNSVKQGVVKKVLSVSASSSSSSASTGLKVAKTVGTKAAKAATVIGIKTLLLNLVFGKINQLIEWKTRLLDNLERQNRAKNQQFLKPQGTTPSDSGVNYGYDHTSSGGYYTPEHQAVTAVSVLPSGIPAAGYYQPNLQETTPHSNGGYSYSTPGSQQQYGEVSGTAGAGPVTNNSDPDFDPERISLNVPDELFAPAFNSINSISTIIGNVIQNTAERLARFIETLKPLLRSSLGFQSPKRDTLEQESEEEPEDSSLVEESESDPDNSVNKSPIKSSYAALVHRR